LFAKQIKRLKPMLSSDPQHTMSSSVTRALFELGEQAYSGIRIVTLSRNHGSGGEEIALQLAQRLQVPCYDKELLNALIREAHMDRSLMERLDERISPVAEEWLFGLLSGRGVANEDYRRYLRRVVFKILKQGGVIVGRGAHLLPAKNKPFRLRIVGSLQNCAQRLAQEKGLPLAEALKEVEAINSQRAEFIRRQFGGDINDPAAFDLILNTDNLAVPQAVEVALFAMKQAGLNLPQKVDENATATVA